MRTSLFFIAGLLGVVACSSSGTGSEKPAPAPAPTTTTIEPLTCAPRPNAICDALDRGAADSPALASTIAWAEVTTAPTSPDRQGGIPKVALLEDGTLQRTRVEATLLEYFTHPPGLVLAKVDAPSVARIRADVAAVQAADLQGYFGEDETDTSLTSSVFDVIRIPQGTACLHSSGDAHSACAPAVIARLRDDLGELARAAEVKYRDTTYGTVAIGGDEVGVMGTWPLGEDRAVSGPTTLTASEWASLGQKQGLFVLESGDTVYVTSFGTTTTGAASVYLSRSSVVVLGDDMADLRAQLLANPIPPAVEAYAFTGIPLGPDRFPYFKNHDYARIPATATAPASLRDLSALGHLDLREEGEISLP